MNFTERILYVSKLDFKKILHIFYFPLKGTRIPKRNAWFQIRHSKCNKMILYHLIIQKANISYQRPLESYQRWLQRQLNSLSLAKRGPFLTSSRTALFVCSVPATLVSLLFFKHAYLMTFFVYYSFCLSM